ncbi:MAG: penicillin-binding protein 2 [Candidatus Yanofskybacteria bacterium CG10_big_fil_rev_8_21_14_0_10_37_15]|uniref:Penicillin-binding protein 2 n=1 Tax=Candidatus Yanofskybacteria bacterium CG10_big_fil_rev_8_21_14_0_10_37_15 TaxID=1975097 RepID=A0A2H0R7V0_9BACT|nr:MAG: penicillin-binding protein 2 [Candidatus Yanofskybacteria bacterium CG10_big_fil_rev_8_21_14_0_10_37_15]
MVRLFKQKEYKISLDNEEWVTPEEILVDSGSEHSDIEKPILHGVFRFTFFSVLIFLSIVFIFSFKIAISEHDEYARIALNNKSVNFFVPPPRGLIFDRLGRPLVKNVNRFDLLVISKEIKEKGSVEMKRIAEILKISEDEFKVLIDENSQKSSIFFAAKNLTKEQVLGMKYLDPRGFYTVSFSDRFYIEGHQFSSILGYVGKVNIEDLKDEYYKPTDMKGKLGIELWYEELLRGEHGKIFFTSEKQNYDNSEEENEHQNFLDPVMGQNLVLNIDYELQKKLYNELYDVLSRANLSRGAAIIQNPSNGQVLAMVSFPSFDNNLFVSGLSENDFKNLFESKSRPLFNRVIGGLYNPGSVIKPFMGLMTLQENIFTSQDVIRDCVRLVVPNQFNPDSPAIFKNWREDTGLFNLRRAIADSCNIYFFIAGGGFGDIKGLGITKIAEYLKLTWVDKILGIDLPGEGKGFVPTPSWKEDVRGEPWYQGDTYNVSIGQGDLLVTPLWLNSYISAIANGGFVYKPQVAQRIVDENKNDIKTFQKEDILKLPFDVDVISEIKNDMEETVISGTAKLLQNLPVKAGAKTGTAEVIKGQSVNALFSAFAPFDNPEIAITVLVEGASSNQGSAIVVADEVLKWYFSR